MTRIWKISAWYSQDRIRQIRQSFWRKDLFGDMICKLRQLYDYVIIDTPPMANLIDGAIVARQVRRGRDGGGKRLHKATVWSSG